MFTTDIIDNEWKKYHDRKLKNTTHESIQKRTDEYRISNTDDNNTSSKIMKFNGDVEMDIEELADKSDDFFFMKVAPDLLKTPHSKELRSHHISKYSESSEKRSTQYFPKIPLRYSRKKKTKP